MEFAALYLIIFAVIFGLTWHCQEDVEWDHIDNMTYTSMAMLWLPILVIFLAEALAKFINGKKY